MGDIHDSHELIRGSSELEEFNLQGRFGQLNCPKVSWIKSDNAVHCAKILCDRGVSNANVKIKIASATR